MFEQRSRRNRARLICERNRRSRRPGASDALGIIWLKGPEYWAVSTGSGYRWSQPRSDRPTIGRLRAEMREWLFNRVEVGPPKVPVSQIGSRAVASTVMMDARAIGILLAWLPRFIGSFGAFDDDRAHGFGGVNRR